MVAFPTGDNFVPSFSSTNTRTAKVLRAEFGDGFNQRAAAGINNIRIIWSNIWIVIPKADADTMQAFFVARGGHESFDFDDPESGTTFKVVVEEWQRAPVSKNFATMNAEFLQVFDN